jgi:hypothetical protein
VNQSLQALVGSIRRSLREEILPELGSDHARSQLAGVLDILGKMESMVVWSPDVTREQLVLLDTCIADAMARITVAGLVGPADMDPSGIAASHENQATLEGALQDAERRFARLTDWLFDAPQHLPSALSDELHALLRMTLRSTLKAQRRLVPSADFSSMTAPRHPGGAQGDST